MSATPRLQSAFPQTPQTNERIGRRVGGFANDKPIPVKPTAQDPNAPLIPFEVIDAPSQRRYVVAFYAALNAWRFYEWWVSSSELDSTWLFLKWIAIDGVFLFALPALRIPWLEWAFSTTLALFLIHAVANVFLMFHIPIPLGIWASALVRVAYDRELSISERRVKAADILHNSSLILGKQIIKILPEGSAVLNPDRIPLCLDSHQTSVTLPIRINQTTPSLIELLRIDLETGANETITISSKQVKQLKRQADKGYGKLDTATSRDLLFSVKKPGVYQLQKVIDESKLEVHRRSLDTLVARCPKAVIRPSPPHKCKGELSDLVLEVEGIPPLKIKYSRRINQVDHSFSFQSIQPEYMHSPLIEPHDSGAPVHSKKPNITWAQMQKVQVPLNESLSTGGEWLYAIEEVHDAYGNIANYSSEFNEVDQSSSKTAVSQHRRFSVHERPRISFSGCNSQKFLEVAKEDSIELPIHFHAIGRSHAEDAPYSLTYSFDGRSPDNDLPTPEESRNVAMRSVDHTPRVKDPGWYTLTAVSSQFCSGEVFEPASCFLHNPPEPMLAVRHEKLFDKCANNAIGLLVDLDLIGTPPFRIRYNIEHSRGVQSRVQVVDSLRGQLDLTPSEAGHYRYKFLDLSDSVYEPRSLKDKVPILEQDVKPPASAHFVGPRGTRKACFGEPVSVDVSFFGESPWVLQYELVHNGKRTKHELKSEEEIATLVTENLLHGGEYTLALTGVKDKSGCKRLLEEDIKIEARPKKPQASFGQLDKQRNILALEDRKIELPLRLEGEAPWKVKFQNLDRPSAPAFEKTLWNANSEVKVDYQGRYEMIAVDDATCPGSIDRSANIFNVSWIPRPSITAVDGVELNSLDVYKKREVCEGDEDGLEVKFTGTPPYTVKYEQRNPNAGSTPLSVKSFTAPLNSALIQMDTSKPGDCSYKFTELGDNLYSHDGRKHTPLVVNQKVNPRPFARFSSPGHIYGFCKDESNGEEVIPITLEGVPPFSLEISIKHHSHSKAELVSIPNINSNKHNLPIPRRHLDLGQHVVSIHKVRDSRGCQRTIGNDASSVRVAVSDVPTITPLESQVDYCVGERISYSLSGQAPFEVFYTFEGTKRKATSTTTNFRRIAEAPGEFTITGVSDAASGKCEAHKNITKVIHEMPSVKISKGQESTVDIHEGGEAEIQFEFWGTPPFEFSYTRSSNPTKGKKSAVLETKHDTSYEHTKSVRASDEGIYEVVSIKDKFCSFSRQRPEKNSRGGG